MRAPRPLSVVIKLGTSSIVDETTHEPHFEILKLIVATAVKLREDGHRVVIVSSGAIGVSLQRMGYQKRPKRLSKLQALAAIGQCRLMSLWDNLFMEYRQPIAQVLLTRNDIADRSRYLNAQRTFNELLEMGVIPIVNENDTLAVAEIKFGDNDTLSAFTAVMVHADMLFLMTDVDCLYDKNPRTHPDAEPIEVVEDIATLQADVSSAGSALGTGGMYTKIVAARIATSSGVTTVITKSSKPGNIAAIVAYLQAIRSPARGGSISPTPAAELSEPHILEPTAADSAKSAIARPPLHTRFIPSPHPIPDRHFWLLHGPASHGTVYIDAGAHRALINKAGLLPAGVVDVDGQFAQYEAVRLMVVERTMHHHGGTPGGSGGRGWSGTPVEVGRARVNFSASEIARIKGHQSAEIEGLLGYADSEYVAERGYISLSLRQSQPTTPRPGTPSTPSRELDGMAGYECR